MRPYGLLVTAGLVLCATAATLGGWGAGVGGLVALAAQSAAVALLRPAMRAPQPVFMARWLGGMGIRALGLGAVLVAAGLGPAELPPLETSLGFLGVLLPLLFLETRFLK